jgi:hypothetical protein
LAVHPAWLAEVQHKLAPAGDRLFALRLETDAEVGKGCRFEQRFTVRCLTAYLGLMTATSITSSW